MAAPVAAMSVFGHPDGSYIIADECAMGVVEVLERYRKRLEWPERAGQTQGNEGSIRSAMMFREQVTSCQKVRITS
jgi:hypothetical protein